MVNIESPAETAEVIEVSFGIVGLEGPGNYVLDRVRLPTSGKDNEGERSIKMLKCIVQQLHNGSICNDDRRFTCRRSDGDDDFCQITLIFFGRFAS